MLNIIAYNKKQWFTLFLFFLLLIWRFTNYPIAELIAASNFSQYSILYLRAYSLCNYLFITIILWLNKADLSKLKVRKSFFYLFIISGLLHSILYFSLIFALIFWILSVWLLYDFKKVPYQFGEKQDTKIAKLVVPTLFLWVPYVLFIWLKFSINELDISLGEAFWTAFYQTDLLGIAIEEFVFRGMLWMLLAEIGYTEVKILTTQTFLFWFAHYYHIYNIGFFWFVVPIASYLLGVIVLRAKSITPSTIVHYGMNLMIRFLQLFKLVG